MFDLNKVMQGEASTVPDDLLTQTFFTKDKNDTENKLEKHGFTKKLKDILK
jgi:hypothetical protein